MGFSIGSFAGGAAAGLGLADRIAHGQAQRSNATELMKQRKDALAQQGEFNKKLFDIISGKASKPLSQGAPTYGGGMDNDPRAEMAPMAASNSQPGMAWAGEGDSAPTPMAAGGGLDLME